MKSSNNKNQFLNNTSFIVLHGDDWYQKQKVAGKVVAGALSLLENLVKKKSNLSLLEMNKLAEEYIESHDCQCTFKGYKNFPNGVCISVDNTFKNEMVHGIPKINEVLRENDIVKFDLGATYKGAIADSAISCIYGEPKSQSHIDLLKDTRDALMKGIASIKIEDPIGSIGNAIYNHGIARKHGVILQYGGHGLSWDIPHARPFVANKAEKTDCVRAQNGMALAIEPMFTLLGGIKTRVGNDGWTVHCESITSHWEHSIFLHNDRVEIMTLRDGELIA